MEYYSTIRKSEILSLVTTWMDLEGTILSKISQRKINTICFHLYVESKRQYKQTIRKRPIDTENADGGQKGGDWEAR